MKTLILCILFLTPDGYECSYIPVACAPAYKCGEVITPPPGKEELHRKRPSERTPPRRRR